MENTEKQMFQLMNGDVRVWIAQETIHLIAFNRPHHDPVELTTDMAKELAAQLGKLAQQLEDK